MDNDDDYEHSGRGLRYSLPGIRGWATAQQNNLALVRTSGLEPSEAEAKKKSTVIATSRFTPEQQEALYTKMKHQW